MKATKRIAWQAAATNEQQLANFIKKFDPKNAALIRSVRKALRARLPTANELVYDNYNFFCNWLLFDRATVRLHLVYCRGRKWNRAVVLLRSHAS
jgi:hypothetical protein